jgi:adenosylmethionine-8-amino-7-oxononanoate aminotransferase
MESLLARDLKVSWHPFSQMLTAPSPIPIVSGKGLYLYSEDGSAYLDAISSLWVNLHGHCHPYIIEQIHRQLTTLEHAMFWDATHPSAVILAERLLQALPKGFGKVFFSDNGSTAVETALKMVFQYWYNEDPQTKKHTIVAFEGAYHGDTFGSMSMAGKAAFTRPFSPFLFQVASIPPPFPGKEQQSIDRLKTLIQSGTIAGFIFEPIVQGVRGMISHSASGLSALMQLCRQNQIITIADEVMTGFGRLSPLFASELLTEVPDIICLAKGLTGGYLPLAATVVKEPVFQAFLSKDLGKALLHGHSYTANPLGCAAAIASLDLLENETCTKQRTEIENQHKVFCEEWSDHPKLKRCQTLGTILALEYRTSEQDSYYNPIRDRLLNYFLKEKIFLRPFGNMLHLVPPYCIQPDELNYIYQRIITTFTEQTW